MIKKTFGEVAVDEFFVFESTMQFLNGEPVTNSDWNLKVVRQILPWDNNTQSLSNCIYCGGQPDFVCDDVVVCVASSPEDEATYPNMFYYK
jgi:hypothetical protein